MTFSTWLSTAMYQSVPGVLHSARPHHPKAKQAPQGEPGNREPAPPRAEPTGEPEGQAHDDQRPDRPQRILGEPGGAEGGEAAHHESPARTRAARRA